MAGREVLRHRLLIQKIKQDRCTRSASSPSQSKPIGFASSPKVGALGSPRKLHLFAKASPFGRGGCERSEQTERASLLK